MLPPRQPAVIELARQFLTSDTSTALGDDPNGAPDRACRRLSDELAQWVGGDGARALFARALRTARATGSYPVLKMLRTNPASGRCLDGLTEGAQRYGLAAANDAAVAVLAALIELLGRLIGDDMAVSLLDQSANGRAPTPKTPRHDRGTS